MAAAPFIVAGMAVLSTVVSVAGTIAQGNAAAGAANANAAALQQQARLEQEQGVVAYQQGMRASQIARGKSLAALSDSGIDPSQGSPLDLLDQQARTGEYNAEEAKFQYDEQAWRMSVAGGLQTMAGEAAQSTATGKAIATGFGGAVGAATPLIAPLGKIDFGDNGPPTPVGTGETY